MKLNKDMLCFGLMLLASITTNVFADASGDEFNQSIQKLQQAPTDAALREQIIRQAQQLKPAPMVPEEARRFFVRGNTVMSEAKGNDDYARAVQLYEESLKIAPWWADPYFNLAKAKELQQDFSGAIKALKNYLLTNPPEKEARQMQDHIYALEEKGDKQAELVAAKNREEENRKNNEQQAAAVIQRVQSIVSGKTYERWFANVGNPYDGAMSQGVTEAEYKGSVWWGWPAGKPVQQYVIDGKSIKICFIPDGGGISCEYSLSGVPNGPNISDISWSDEVLDGGQKKNKRVWARLYEDTGEIIYSNNRPLNDSEYNPNVRYHYWWYRLYPVRR